MDENIVLDEKEVEERWKEHFKEFLSARRADKEEGKGHIRVEQNIRKEEFRNGTVGHIYSKG